jgi:hypothetical protein
MSTSFVLQEDCRIRVASGDAVFHDAEGRQLENNVPGRWITIPRGSTVLLCSKFEATDTFCVAILLAAERGGQHGAPVGAVLRKLSWEKLQASAGARPPKSRAKDPLFQAARGLQQAMGLEEAPSEFS